MNLDITDIPASVTTIEQLAVWSAQALAAANPGLAFTETVGALESPAIDQNVFTDPQSLPHAVFRISLKLSPDFFAVGGRVFEAVSPLSAAALPQSFKA